MKSISQKGFSKIALIVVGVVLVLAIGGGVAYLWYVNNQDTRDKIQTNSNNQNSNTQTTAETTTKTTTKTTDETVDWKTYNGGYGSAQYSFNYPNNYIVYAPYEEEVYIKDNDTKVLSWFMTACSTPVTAPETDYNVAFDNYNTDSYLQIPVSGCIRFDKNSQYSKIIDQILSTFKFTK